MTDFADLQASIKDWANRQDWSDALVVSFIRMAEQKFNQELRIALMIKHSASQIADRCGQLPPDWLEMQLVRIESTVGADGFTPIHYKPQDEFFRTTVRNDQYSFPTTSLFYTIVGTEIYFGGIPDTVNGTTYKIAYFSAVPVLSDTQTSWLYTKYPSLYLYSCMMNAAMHAIGEEQSAANWKQLAEDTILKLNNEYMRSRASGSRLSRTGRRSFG
jgi:hypothetical protein